MKMGKEKKAAVDGPIYDARTLGTPKMLVLGVQHLFAMFGATVLVPILTGLSVSATLLFAGLATLFMHLVTGKKVPVFLGSSFAFLPAPSWVFPRLKRCPTPASASPAPVFSTSSLRESARPSARRTSCATSRPSSPARSSSPSA